MRCYVTRCCFLGCRGTAAAVLWAAWCEPFLSAHIAHGHVGCLKCKKPRLYCVECAAKTPNLRYAAGNASAKHKSECCCCTPAACPLALAPPRPAAGVCCFTDKSVTLVVGVFKHGWRGSPTSTKPPRPLAAASSPPLVNSVTNLSDPER